MIRNPSAFEARLQEFRSWTLEHCVPLENEVERSEALPHATVDQMRALGLFGLSIPQAYGGSGMTLEELCLSGMELAYAAMAFRARYSGNTGIASEGLVLDGTEEQRQFWLPRMAYGVVTGCMALTEPEAGSDATNIQATAREEADSFVLDGLKTYVTNAPLADLFTVYARTGAGRGADGVTAFLVPSETPGLAIGEPYRKMGLRGSPVCDVRLEGCRVPRSAVLGGNVMIGKGFSTALKVLNKQRIHLSAMAVAQSRRLVDEGLSWAMQRRQFGQSLVDFQLVQAMLAESQVEYQLAQAITLQMARRYDEGADVTMEASVCKYFSTESVGRTADRVLQIFGGQGFNAAAGIERIYRDVRVLRLYEGTSQIHLVNIAKQMVKKARAASGAGLRPEIHSTPVPAA